MQENTMTIKTIEVLLFNGETNVPCVRRSDYDALAARLAEAERELRVAARLLREYESDAHPEDVPDVIRWLAVYGSRQARIADSASGDSHG